MADMRVQVSAESLAEDAIEPDLIAGNVESDGADVDGDETITGHAGRPADRWHSGVIFTGL